MDLKSPLKVPAVFRLLRPEFRDLLKSNSCQVPIDAKNGRIIPIATERAERSPSSERVIPISVESTRSTDRSTKSTERVIPVVRDETPKRPAAPDARRIKTDITKNAEFRNIPAVNSGSTEKPALPAKPVSSPVRSPPTVPKNGLTTSEAVVTSREAVTSASGDFSSPKLVSNVLKNSNGEKISNKFDDLRNDLDEVIEDEDEELLAEYPTAGVRERTLLCPIQEEDTESTASGSSVSIRKSAPNNSNNVIKTDTEEKTNTTEVVPEEIRDGHYFIKVIIF